MAEKTGIVLDRAQVKKAVQALQAFLKTKATGDSLFLDETQQISLLITLWKIPKDAQTIRIPLPHGQRLDTDEVCLFTRDEPRMTSDQTQRFYKKLLEERGVKNISEIIPYKVLKTEYKPYEAKRRLLGNFDMFISDDRIRRLLPSHLGKHFYQSKKEPLCVNLQSKHLARDIERVIQGTSLKVTNKGCCCMVRVAHSGMTADEVSENIEAAVQTVVAKLRMKGPVIKLIHVKSQSSVALPIYTSDLSHLSMLEKEHAQTPKEEETAAKKKTKTNKKEDKKPADSPAKKKKTEDIKPADSPVKKKKTEDEKPADSPVKKKKTEDKKPADSPVKKKKTEDIQPADSPTKKKKTEDKKPADSLAKKKKTEDKKQADATAEKKGKKVIKKKKTEDEEEEEEIPQLVPIETPSKKPKLEKPSKKKQLEKAPKPAAVKKGTKAQSKLTKTDSKVKRKVPKVK